METFEEKFRNRYQLSEADISALLSHMEEVRFKKKEVIVQEGTKNTNLYLIKEGIWRGHYLKDGVYGLPRREKQLSLYGDTQITLIHK